MEYIWNFVTQSGHRSSVKNRETERLFLELNSICTHCVTVRRTFMKRLKGSIHHFRKIGGCLDDHVFSSLFFISSRCFEPVGLTKNLTKNRKISLSSSFLQRILNFCFKNAFTLSVEMYINKSLTRLSIFSVKG